MFVLLLTTVAALASTPDALLAVSAADDHGAAQAELLADADIDALGALLVHGDWRVRQEAAAALTWLAVSASGTKRKISYRRSTLAKRSILTALSASWSMPLAPGNTTLPAASVPSSTPARRTSSASFENTSRNNWLVNMPSTGSILT